MPPSGLTIWLMEDLSFINQIFILYIHTLKKYKDYFLGYVCCCVIFFMVFNAREQSDVIQRHDDDLLQVDLQFDPS